LCCVLCPVFILLEIWCVHESLLENYESFTLLLKEHSTSTVVTLRSKWLVRVRIALSVWWAQFWRYCLGIIVAGILVMGPSLGLAALFDSISGVTLGIGYVLWKVITPIPISIWATRESLVNNYRSFDLEISSAPEKQGEP